MNDDNIELHLISNFGTLTPKNYVDIQRCFSIHKYLPFDNRRSFSFYSIK